MHERSLAQALLTQVSGIVQQHSGAKVVAIRLSIGEFSGVEPDLLHLALEEFIAESPFRGANVEMAIVQLEAKCLECQTQFAVESFRFVCPVCGCQRTQILRGEELILESLVLKEVEPCPTPN